MTQKQYADMHTIMACCRIFSDQMYKCLSNAGLLEQGYAIKMYIGDNNLFDGCTENEYIELEQSILEHDFETWDKGRMTQRIVNKGRWYVDVDPIAETGSIPPEVCYKERTDLKRDSKSGGKPYPPDGMWLSAYDYYPHVGGGR